jgi:hypothetical protein
MCSNARSTSASSLRAASGPAPSTNQTRRHIRGWLPRETPPNQWASGSFAKLRWRTSDHGVVLALPESRSSSRFPISASQAC